MICIFSICLSKDISVYFEDLIKSWHSVVLRDKYDNTVAPSLDRLVYQGSFL